jgi:lipid-binding SYLF domain-containing protein
VIRRTYLAGIVAALALAAIAQPQPARAATAKAIDTNVDEALRTLYASNPTAKALGEQAKAVLVFPLVLKGGFIIGGQWGDGALRQDGKTVGYYRTIAGSIGLQAGVQSFGYALFLMTEGALDYLKSSNGWEIGVGPTVTVLDKGAAASLSTTTAKSDVYAITFDQKGLMAGISVEGAKVSPITPEA